MKLSLPTLLLMLMAIPAGAQVRTFDVHVHLHQGESSLEQYDQQAAAAGKEVTGYGIMWFGGPNMALQGNPADIRLHNDQLLALAAKHPKALPIATVHPYDGDAALRELERVASKGIKVLK